MPKFTDLPVATTAKDNDIFSIVDPDANESRQIDLVTLRTQIAGRGILYGAAVQGLALPSGGALQQITGYASQLPAVDPNLDPLAGTIIISGNTSGFARFSIYANFDLLSPSNADNNYYLYIRQFDGATTTDRQADQLYTTDNGLTSVSFNSTFVLPVIDGDVITLHLASSNVAQSVNVQQSSFIMESI